MRHEAAHHGRACRACSPEFLGCMELWGQRGTVDANEAEARKVICSSGGEEKQRSQSICAGSFNEPLDQLRPYALPFLAFVHDNGAKEGARPVQLQPCCSHERAFALCHEEVRQVVGHSLSRQVCGSEEGFDCTEVGGAGGPEGEHHRAHPSVVRSSTTRARTSSRISRTRSTDLPFGSSRGQSPRFNPGTYGQASPQPMVMSH